MRTATPRIDRPKVVSRFLAIGATAVLVSSASLVAATSASATSGHRDTSSCWCTAKQVDRPVDVYTKAKVVDPGVAVYVGGDLTVTTATEIEGRVVVAGDADFAGSGTLNVGTAGGGGSAIAPQGRTDHLVVGGNLTTGPKLQVGFNAAGGGGNVLVGGTITGQVSTEPYQGRAGTVKQGLGAAALADYKDLGDVVTQTAAGAAGAVPAQVVGGALTIAPGVHEISAADAARLSALNITSRGAVTIVVRGTSVAIDGLKHVEVDGTRVYQQTQYLSRDILWVFPDATSVHLGTNDQFPGTIVVPQANSTLTLATSTNGRILAAGDVAYTGGAGIEHHNYPWSGECTDTPTRNPAPTPTPTPTPTDEVSPTPTPTPLDVVEPSPSPSPSASPTPLAAVSPSPSPSPAAVVPGATDDGGNGDAAAPSQDGLAHTGAAVAGAIVAAIVLLAGGLVLLRLRRRSGRHTVEA